MTQSQGGAMITAWLLVSLLGFLKHIIFVFIFKPGFLGDTLVSVSLSCQSVIGQWLCSNTLNQ